MQKDNLVYLEDILQAILQIEIYLHKISFRDFTKKKNTMM